MRKIIKDKLIGEKCWINTISALFLLGFVLFNAFETSAQMQPQDCGTEYLYPVSTLNADLVDANNHLYDWAYFNIYRDGFKDRYLQFELDVPDTTIFKVFINNAEVGTMHRYLYNGREFWQWEESVDKPAQVIRIGDTVKVTKDGQPFLTGTFVRYIYDWANIAGAFYHQIGNVVRCSMTFGYVYLPSSQYPRRLAVFPFAYTTSPVTRISVNEPGVLPNTVGAEIANVPITAVTTTGPTVPTGWQLTKARNNDIRLTELQYQMLKLGLLSVNVFTQSSPQGFSRMPLTIYFINAGGDFEGDGQADLAVYRPSDQNWYVLYSSNNEFHAVPFGLASDKPVIGDFDHDGESDITNFQVDNPDYPGLGVWKIQKSSDNSTNYIQWGLNTDIPLAMDIDGNNTSDLVIFRPSDGTWYINKMGDIIKPRNTEQQNFSRFEIIKWGMAGDKPLTGDFNADGRDEIAVFRPSEGNWYIYDNFEQSYRMVHWGASGDIPMARDFDGDARADIAVYRPSEGKWYILGSIFDQIIIRQFGLSEDIPVPSDFDKDGVSDIAVFRPSDATWYITRSSDNTFYAAQFGVSGDIPAMAYR
jgi:hypothetical protein